MQHQFLTLIEEHSAAINRVCRSICHTTEDCEDLRQDIILNLWLGWSRYRPTAKPVTWVWRVAVNTGISWWRHRHRQVETSPLEGIELPDNGLDRENREWLHDLILYRLSCCRFYHLFHLRFRPKSVYQRDGLQSCSHIPPHSGRP